MSQLRSKIRDPRPVDGWPSSYNIKLSREQFKTLIDLMGESHLVNEKRIAEGTTSTTTARYLQARACSIEAILGKLRLLDD